MKIREFDLLLEEEKEELRYQSALSKADDFLQESKLAESTIEPEDKENNLPF